jgi:hypothetical protein
MSTLEPVPAEPGEPQVLGDGEVPELPAQTGELKLTATDLGVIVTVNEARASIGLGPMLDADGSPTADGDLTLAEFKAKHEAVVSTAASAGEGTSTKAPDGEAETT